MKQHRARSGSDARKRWTELDHPSAADLAVAAMWNAVQWAIEHKFDKYNNVHQNVHEMVHDRAVETEK